MFSKDLEVTIGQCYKQAREQRHEFMTVEHLLLALTENQSAVGALRACGVDLPRLSAELDTNHRRDRAGAAALATSATRSPRWASSACCSARSTTCSPRAERKSPAPTCWWRSSARRTRMPCISCTSRRSPGWTWSITSRTASPRSATSRRPVPPAAEREGEEGGEPKGNPLQRIRQQPQRARAGRQDRSADRPRRRDRAHHPGAVPSPQEQPALRG